MQIQKLYIILTMVLLYKAPMVACKIRGAKEGDNNAKETTLTSIKKYLRRLQANGATVVNVSVRPAGAPPASNANSGASTTTPGSSSSNIRPAGSMNMNNNMNRPNANAGGTLPPAAPCPTGQTLLFLNENSQYFCASPTSSAQGTPQANSGGTTNNAGSMSSSGAMNSPSGSGRGNNGNTTPNPYPS